MAKKHIHHPHNNFFQHFFQHKEVVEASITHCMPSEMVKKINLSTLQFENTDFLPSKYRSGRRTDALWTSKTHEGEEIALHFEHQSSPSYLIIGRLLEYRAAYIRYKLEQYKSLKKIPGILSIVFYHSKKPWQGPSSISGLFERPDIFFQSLSDDFLVDLTNKPIGELKKYGAAALPSIILSNQPSGDMCHAFEDIVPLLKDANECCRDAAIEYMSTVDEHEEVVFFKELSKFDKETARKYKTMFEQAIQRTEKKFLTLGIQQGKSEAAVALLKAGVNPNLIKKSLNISEIQMKNLFSS